MKQLKKTIQCNTCTRWYTVSCAKLPVICLSFHTQKNTCRKCVKISAPALELQTLTTEKVCTSAQTLHKSHASVQTQTPSNVLPEDTKHMIEQGFVKLKEQICSLTNGLKIQVQLLSKIETLKDDKEKLKKRPTAHIYQARKLTRRMQVQRKQKIQRQNFQQQKLNDSDIIILRTKFESSEVCKRTVEKDLRSMEERYSLRCNKLVKKDRDIHTMRNSVPDLAAIANTHFMPKAVLNDNFLKTCEKYV